jgi:hypothetical protein
MPASTFEADLSASVGAADRREWDYDLGMANLGQLSLYVSPDRPSGKPNSVHIGDDGGMTTLCSRQKSGLLPVEGPDETDQELCEKCLVWAKDYSLI